MGKVYICIIMEHTNTAIVMSDSISTDNPIFSGVYNLAVKIRVLLKFGTVLSQIGSNLSLLFFYLFSFFLPFLIHSRKSTRRLFRRSNDVTRLTDISCFFALFFIFKILFLNSNIEFSQ